MSTALLPLSWLFRAAVTLRRSYYQLRGPNNLIPQIFTIVVGNITVGGTGKTPFAIWLANFCKTRELKVGIVTRGYKRTSEAELIEVQLQSTSAEVGDEAVLLALRTSCPVVVSADRRAAVKFLVDKYSLDVVLSDDGLQHYNLPRNVEIAIVDGEQQFGNGRCLPAGPLREPIKRLETCDLIVYNESKTTAEIAFEVKIDDVVSLSSDTVRKSIEDFKDFTVHASCRNR